MINTVLEPSSSDHKQKLYCHRQRRRRRWSTAFFLAASYWLGTAAGAAPWLTQEDGNPWPHRVRLATTGTGPVAQDISTLGVGSCALVADRPTVLSKGHMAVGAAGVPVPFDAEDTNGDGVADELRFVSEYKGDYWLYWSREPGPTVWGEIGFSVEATRAGSWLPVELDRTSMLETIEGTLKLDPVSFERARRVLAVLRDQQPMLVLRAPRFTLWVGEYSGLIEAMRPAEYQWAGSCMREWASNSPNLPGTGTMELLEESPVRVVIEHRRDQAIRRIEAWVDGTVYTTGNVAWTRPKLFVAANPYEYARTEEETRPLRFSELADAERQLAPSSAVALWGEEAAISCRLFASQLVSRDMWMDWGWLGLAQEQEAAVQGISDRHAVRAEAEQLWRTAMSGAIWVFELETDPPPNFYRLDYRIGRTRGIADPHVGMQRVEIGPTEHAPALVENAPSPALTETEIAVRPLATSVPRLYPNRGYGWQLKPFVRALDNPLTAYFQVQVKPPLTPGSELVGAVESAPWLERVELHSDPAVWTDTAGATHTVYQQHLSLRRENDRFPFRLRAGEEGLDYFLLGLKATEQTDGVVSTRVRVVIKGAAVQTLVEVKVEPSVPRIALGCQGPEDWQVALALGCNAVVREALTARPDLSQWLTREGTLTDAGREELVRQRAELLPNAWGLLVLDDLGLSQFLRDRRQEPTDPLRMHLATAPPEQLTAFFSRWLGMYRPWERWNAGYVGLIGWPDVCATEEEKALIARLYDGFRAATDRPLMHAFLSAEMETPCDVVGLTAGAAELENQGSSITARRRELVAGWMRAPELSVMVAAGDAAEPQCWLVLDAGLRAGDYATLRRRVWWCWGQGLLAGGLAWGLPTTGGQWPGESLVEAVTVPAGVGGQRALTDRALAVMDAHADLALLTQFQLAQDSLRRRGEEAAQVLRQMTELETEAYRLADARQFEAARKKLTQALELAGE